MADNKILSLSLTVALACVPPLLAAQESKALSSDQAPASDFVGFMVISPPTDTALERGKPVALEVLVEFELVSRGTAFIRLIVQNEKRETFAPLQSAKVEKGRNTWKYAGTVKIPKKAGAVHLVAELYDLVQLQLPDFSDAPAEVSQQLAKVRLPRRFAFTEVRFETREGPSATAR